MHDKGSNYLYEYLSLASFDTGCIGKSPGSEHSGPTVLILTLTEL